MNEFKMVVEHFDASIKKVVEVMNHRFDRFEGRMESIEEQVGKLTVGQTELKAGQHRLESRMENLELGQKRLEVGQARLETDVLELKTGQKRLEVGQARLETDVSELKTGQKNLEIGQDEIKAELKCKVSADPFAKLAKRVTKLENKAAA